MLTIRLAFSVDAPASINSFTNSMLFVTTASCKGLKSEYQGSFVLIKLL